MTGKNVPENRYRGIIPKRKIMGNEESFVRVIAHASTGIAKASPVSTATGRAATAHPDATPPIAAATARKIALFMVSRRVTNSTCPWNRSAGRSGVATAAW